MKYIKGKNYQVSKDEFVELPFVLPSFSVAGGLVMAYTGRYGEQWVQVVKGWTWDGASFFLFKWFGTPKRWLTPSLYHDALYEAIRRGIIGREFREPIDRFFRDALIKRGVGRWEAELAYWCIRVGGNFAVRKDVIEREAA